MEHSTNVCLSSHCVLNVVHNWEALFLITSVTSLTWSLPYQESLTEVEDKYKKAMVSNAQLDNDKANLIYQVDTLKDVIEEMEEQMAEMKRELEEKSKVKDLPIKRLC